MRRGGEDDGGLVWVVAGPAQCEDGPPDAEVDPLRQGERLRPVSCPPIVGRTWVRLACSKGQLTFYRSDYLLPNSGWCPAARSVLWREVHPLVWEHCYRGPAPGQHGEWEKRGGWSGLGVGAISTPGRSCRIGRPRPAGPSRCPAWCGSASASTREWSATCGRWLGQTSPRPRGRRRQSSGSVPSAVSQCERNKLRATPINQYYRVKPAGSSAARPGWGTCSTSSR